MNKRGKWFVLCLIILLSTSIPSISLGIEAAPRISDKEIIERLTRIEEGQKAILREMDKRFEAVDRRFEAVDRRFEAVDKRFEDINNRFDQLIKVFIGIIAAFAAIVAVTIGFAIWDRRTVLRPVVEKTDIIRARGDKLEQAIREYAKVEPKMAEILRSLGLL